MENKILAWHFLRDDYTTGEGRLKVTLGQEMSVTGDLILCKWGLHGSIRAIDALGYAPGVIITRTEHSGVIIKGNNKLVSSHRKVIAMADATNVLHEFGCRSAESVLKYAREQDQPILEAAIEAKRKWIRKEFTDQELDAAWNAACSAAWNAACSAVWSATWNAACSAAWSAARSATWNTTWNTACSAAWNAARSDFVSERNQELEQMLSELLQLNEVNQ